MKQDYCCTNERCGEFGIIYSYNFLSKPPTCPNCHSTMEQWDGPTEDVLVDAEGPADFLVNPKGEQESFGFFSNESVKEDSVPIDPDWQTIEQRLKAQEAKAKGLYSSFGLLQQTPNPFGLLNPPPVRIPSPSLFSCPADLTTCPVAQKSTVYLPYKMYEAFWNLAKEMDTEWIAFLLGEEVSPGVYTIWDNTPKRPSVIFPTQKATGSYCEAKDGEIPENAIAAIHSHVGMKVFFSSTDVQHMNFPMELVINRAGDLIANGRVKLDCGRWHRGDATIKLVGRDSTHDALVKELKGKLTVGHSAEWSTEPEQAKQKKPNRHSARPNGRGFQHDAGEFHHWNS